MCNKLRQTMKGRRLSFLLAALLSAIMWVSPSSTWAADPNDDVVIVDGVSYHVLRNENDWNHFRMLVEESMAEYDVNAIMDADFTVTSSVGIPDNKPFRGIFNGNGHTLNVAIEAPYYYVAPFRYVRNATITDLHVTGHVYGTKHNGGLCGFCDDVTIERCWVSVTVKSEDSDGHFVGGFTGHTRQSHITITDCLFDGKLITIANDKYDNFAGAFFGWGEDGVIWDAKRLYENGSCEGARYSIGYIAKKGGGNAWGGRDHIAVYTSHNWGECGDHANYTDQQAVVNAMNSEKHDSWVLVDGKARPVLKSYSLEPTFEAYDIVPGTDSGEEGMVKIPFSCDQAIKWIDAWYTDENGNRKDLARLTPPDNGYSGFLLLPATEAHRDLKMKVRLMIDSIDYTYDPKSDAVMHNPRNLKCDVLSSTTASMTDAGAVRLQWDIKDADYTDIMDGDMFVVMRSLTGKPEDMTSIGSVPLESDVSNYEFKDSTLMSTLTAQQIDVSTGTAQVSYWVVRGVAQQLWGMAADKNPTLVTIQPQLDKLTLLEPTDVKADWSDKEEYKAKVTWSYKANDDQHRYVWDNRASMTLKVKTFKRDESAVDSTTTSISASQLLAGEIEIPVSRSCVKYQIELLIDGSKSPLGHDTVAYAAALPKDQFYHESMGRIDQNSLTVRELQSSVLLMWANVDEEPVDYYEVWRRNVNDKDFECLISDLNEMQFEDKSTSPTQQYEYFVRGVNSCEGLKHDDTKTVTAHCSQTGTVEGYLRFSDGTGIPGIDILITSADNNSWKATTDESGFFRVGNLPYVDNTETTYNAAPRLEGFSDVQPVTFKTTPGGNVVKGVTFEVKQGVKMTGFVLYNGTSIPVQGVSFLVDGREVHTAAGKVVTDFEGKFAFRMLAGDHTIRAVKDGHVFYRGGYFYETDNSTDTICKISGEMPGIYFYDDTRVKLIGRVAGGKDQGSIPLGNSLSRNNLGDDLQIVLALEGDNASRLVSDNQDLNKKERDEVFYHKSHDKKYVYQTNVHTTLNRMVITPDVHTGEYEVLLPPVKWKIQQITAKGYATLFQSGQVGDVIDLRDSLTLHKDSVKGSWMNADKNEVTKVEVEYHAIYNRIYHSPVIIDYKQIGYDHFDYFGDQYYNFKNLGSEKQRLTLAYGVKKQGWPEGKKDSLETRYTFSYPVFSIDRQYPVKISATERYYYNNNIKSDTTDIIRLQGGEVTIHNGLVSSTHRDIVELDSVGEATYLLKVAQVPYLLTGSDALRTVTMTLEMDGTHYEATPLRAYILNIQQLKGAKDILNYSTPLLVDVLRDPPGGASKATLSKGSTLSYSYSMDMSWSAGLTWDISAGNNLSTFTGVVAAPMGGGGVAGFNNSASDAFATSINLVFSGSGNRAFNYTMTANEDISTSSSSLLVGDAGDVYIGVDQNIVVKPATAIRVIPDSVFQQMGGLLKAERMIEIAQGKDEAGRVLHLVRDEVVTFGPVINSNFVHSQYYITKQLIPSLTDQCLSLIFTGTKEQAVQRANATGQLVYLSKVPKEDKNFGVLYDIITPDEYSGDKIDEVAHYHDLLLKWEEMIGRNEQEKLTAHNLVQNYDVDGGASINYSETFSSDYSNTSSFVSPISTSTVDYFDNTAGDIALNAAAFVGPAAAKLIGSVNKAKVGNTQGQTGSGGSQVEVSAVGWTFKFRLTPAMSFGVTPRHTEKKSFNRKESFTIAMDNKSHLNFDVYRVETSTDDVTSDDVMDVFVGNNFDDLEAYNYDFLKREMKLKDYRQPRSFVYRTRGGATCRPYEGERVTRVYNPLSVIDERTKKIENPVIKMDKQSISGVPYGEPARFKVYLTNESEQPDAAYNYFNLYLNETSNPDGAKLMMDGMPLTGNSRTVEVRPGIITEKTLEVYAGEKFDYKGLKIGLISMGDATVNQEVAFDVHYLQTAGKVAITTPGDKWIMNCDAPQEVDKGWYMPVIISDFDKNQHNFDHIELQYKESTRGDDYWTNLCGFYADSTLYAAASGTKEMIPENGNITTRFFGEGIEIEKAYDLRAVLFCRNGNAFLTNESKILSGVKDTRRPQLFGNPDPKDGVLVMGDNIIFHFSEGIEHNYLRETTNFEIKGETNETILQEAPSLQFDGHGYAQSEARRNFTDKNITVEVMILPDSTGQDMPIFSHGRDGKNLQLWLTADRHLRMVVDKRELLGKNVLNSKSFQRVAFVLDNDRQKLTLYSSDEENTMDSVTYSGYGPLIFGATNQSDVSRRSYYKGRMIQARIWNRALDLITLNSYAEKMLTGYEMGLADYYPMNEGKGDYAIDMAQGAHLKLQGADWSNPNSMSLLLDKNEQKPVKGLQLIEKAFHRTAEQDYTLMFWFKTNESGHGALLCNGSGRKTDVGAINKFFIGFEGPTLKYRTYGQEFNLGDGYDDDRWHHYVMTVNRSFQVASIYVDEEMKIQFATDSLGGMTGDFYLGNMVWKDEGAENDKIHQENAFSGHIDGLTLFEQALPISLIKRYASKALGGSEMGLITYVDFERQERQKNNSIVLQPYPLNKLITDDGDGNPIEKADSIFVDPIKDITARIDLNTGAPVQAYEELRNLNFSFVGRDNRILINIDELQKRINKRTIYATVRDIPDLNGNFMASPATVSVFVDLNPLRWAKKTYKKTIRSSSTVDVTFDINIVNNSGVSHTYKVENLPKWLIATPAEGVIDARSEKTLTFTISHDTNVGTYDNIIYLTDEDGLTEPLALDISVEGTQPVWTVPNNMKQYSMSIVARVEMDKDIVTDTEDKVAAFDAKGRCMGVSNISYDQNSSESLVFMSVYDSTTVATPLTFRLWHHETGKIMALKSSQEVKFRPEGSIGTTKSPLILQAGDLYIQHINLMAGWNWVSLNVLNDGFRDVKTLLSSFNWQEGDMLINENSNTSLLYKYGEWLSNKGTSSFDKMKASVSESYRIKVSRPISVDITGVILKNVGDRTITVKQGWNSIGYTPVLNLPVATALADYLDEAEDGDVVKSKTAFAMFTEDANGTRKWKGDLQYMVPGEGYMLYRQRAGEATFVYPFFEPNTTFFDEVSSRSYAYSNNMSLTAVAEGIELQEGDKLIAFADAENVGEATMQGDRIYMTISGDRKTALSFAVERDGEIIATTGQVMNYEVNAISGTYNEPTKIAFVAAEQLPQHGWYTVQGIKLSAKPTRGGVYIYNGRKQVIK